jgi:hypothetical protein
MAPRGLLICSFGFATVFVVAVISALATGIVSDDTNATERRTCGAMAGRSGIVVTFANDAVDGSFTGT